MAVWAAGPSYAVHDNGQFELDGNIAGGAAAGYDWADLFDASGNRLVTPDPNNGPLLASGFVSDAATPDVSYFNSNKDIEPVADWGCVSVNNPTPKDEILNAYAALIAVPANAPDNAGHNVLYLGSERKSNNGSAYAGFWLLKNSAVGCTSPGSFAGTHTDGDVLVLSNYTNGGANQNVTVYRWSGDDATGQPVLDPNLTGAVCGGAATDTACAIANSASVTSPWAPTSHPSQTFVETGLDLTDLLGQAGGCFTTFLAETRTSPELSATLKDYAAGQFNTCPPAPITTQASGQNTLNAPGSAQTDTATLTAVGNRPVPTGSVKFYLCSPAQVTAAGCPTGGTLVSTGTIANGTATSDATTATTALGKYCWRAEYTPDAAASGYYLPNTHTNATTECFTIVYGTPDVSTQIQVTGANAPGLGFTTLGDKATFTGILGTPVAPDATVNFSLYGPFAAGVTPVCTGTAAFTTTGTLAATATPGTFTATTANTFQPTSVGKYVWVASWGGNALNQGATETCDAPNESVTIVGAKIDVAKSANPPGPVSAGQTIGFDITVSNSAAVPATGVVVTDTLPAGGSLTWTLDPAYTGCSITGALGSQVLTCTLGTVNPNTTLPVIHVSSPTTPADCGVINNKATITTTNGTGGDSDIASVRVNCADVTLTKTADAASVSAGSQIGFTVTATNSNAANTGTALGVTINDPLPGGAGIDWSIASGPANCSIQGSPQSETLVCTAVDLAPGASIAVHVVSNTAFASCKTYSNTATLNGSNVGQLTASASTTVLCPDLTLTKTAAASPVNAGSDISFTITLGNTGAGTATNATITDPLPGGPGVSWSISPAVPGCAITGQAPNQTLACTFATLAPEASVSVTLTSATAFASCGTYPNTATAGASNVPKPITASASITVLCANVVITKTADAGTVTAGQAIGFTITVSNTGAGTASTVTINDPLPTGVTWSFESPVAGCSISNGSLTCGFGDLAAGASRSVHIIAPTTYEDCATYTNTATVTSSNSPSAQASATTTVQCPDLSIVKTADAATVDAGDAIGFTVTVSNSTAVGTGTATDVTLNDPLPAGDGVSWSIDPAYQGPGICDITGAVGSQVLSCSFGSLALGAAASVHVTSATEYASCAAYLNTATAEAGNHPKIEASARTTVLCPDLTIVKTADDASVDAGDPIGFVVSISNADAEGTGVAKGVTIDDPLPGGSGVDWSIAQPAPENCSIESGEGGQSLVCTAFDLAPGESLMVHVVSGTEFASCGTYDNTARFLAANAPAGSAEASLEVLCSDLSLTKVADSDTAVTAGDPIGFTVAVSNSDAEGTGTAKGVVISDPLPAGPEGSGVLWSLDEGYEGPCAIAGDPGSQVLTCQVGDLAPGASSSVHISSPTQFESCAQYDNTASLTADNAPGLTAEATTVVACPKLVVTKTADDASVAAGNAIGFTVTASNTGDAPATGTVLNDPLPKGSDVKWSIDPAYDGPGTCAIEGAAGSQVLVCDLGTVPPTGTASVHIVSDTTTNSCAVFTNTASLGAANHPTVTATATTQVTGCLGVEPVPPVNRPEPPLAVTGAGPLGAELAGALLLIVGGGLLTLAATRRRRAH